MPICSAIWGIETLSKNRDQSGINFTIDGLMTICPYLKAGNSDNLVIGENVANCISVTILQQDEPGKEK